MTCVAKASQTWPLFRYSWLKFALPLSNFAKSPWRDGEGEYMSVSLHFTREECCCFFFLPCLPSIFRRSKLFQARRAGACVVVAKTNSFADGGTTALPHISLLSLPPKTKKSFSAEESAIVNRRWSPLSFFRLFGALHGAPKSGRNGDSHRVRTKSRGGAGGPDKKLRLTVSIYKT